jgi:hypothetical protein
MLPNCSASFGVDGPASRPTVRCRQPSDHCRFHLRQLPDQSAVVGLQFGVAQGQDLDLDLVGIDRRGGLEVSNLLGVPPPLLLAGLVQFPRSLAKFVGPRTGCLVGGQERLTTAATGER